MNLDLDKFELKKGSHKKLEDGACIMELVSYMANEPWSDHPKCACPVLTSMAIRINDRTDTETRQKLKPLIPLLLNTKADSKTEIARANFIVHRSITVTFPIFAEALGLSEIAKELKEFKNGDFLAMRDYCRAKVPDFREAGRKNAYAYAYADAYAYAYDAADAYADAYAAAYAADADAYAAYAAADAAYAAYAAADAAEKWKTIRTEINESSIETLRLACLVKG